MQATIEAKIKAHPDITLFEHHNAIDLITGATPGLADNRRHGSYLLALESGTFDAVAAQHTLLATGGTGKFFMRRESRGLHFSHHYPDTLSEARNTVLVR